MSNELKVDVSYVIFVPNGVYFVCIETSIEKQVNETERERERYCSEERKSSSSNDVMLCDPFGFFFFTSSSSSFRRQHNKNVQNKTTTKNCVCVVRWCGVIDGFFVVDFHS